MPQENIIREKSYQSRNYPTIIFSSSGHLLYSNRECKMLTELSLPETVKQGRSIHYTELFNNISPIATAIRDGINLKGTFSETKFVSNNARELTVQIEALSNTPPSDVLIRFKDTDLPNAKTEKKEYPYQTLFNEMIHGVFYQKADGSLIDINPAALELLGLTREQFLKKKSSDEDWDVIHEDGTTALPDEHPSTQALVTGKPVKNKVLGVYNPDREDYVWLNINAIPQFENGKSKPYQVFVTLTDITEQKKSEIKLLERDNRLKSIFRALPAGIGIVSNRKLKDVNEHLCNMIGYTRDELVGQPARILYPDDEQYEFVGTEKYRQIIKKGIGTVETRWIHKDGSSIDIILSSSPIDKNNPFEDVTFTAIDISDRKHSEERIHYLTNLLRSIRNVNQLIVKEKEHEKLLKGICDTLTQNQGYNSSWICIFDETKKVMLAEESGLGGIFRNLDLKTEDLPLCVKMIQSENCDHIKLKPSEDCITCPLKCINEASNALVSSLRYNNKLYGMLAASIPAEMADDIEVKGLFKEVAEDISFALYNLELEELQKQSTELVNKIINAIPDLVWLKDKNGKYITCNPRFESFFGSEKELIEGKDDYDFVDRELADIFTYNDRMAITKGKPTLNEEEITYASDGHHEILETIKTPIYDTSGELIGVLGIGRDITARKNFEHLLIQSKEIAEEMNRTKSSFLANMSHELRTPLNSVIGFAQILNEKMCGDLTDKQIKYVQNILGSSKHLLDLINDVLDISRIESGNMEFNPEMTDISKTIKEIQNLIEPLARKKHIDLSIAIDQDDIKISVDQIKFKDILYNLLSNAIKFTDEKGKIEVISEISDTEVQISVSDTGIGIKEENYDLIFEPFKQTDSFLTRKYSGTGLGLALVKHYVEMHGGTIRVESELEKGSKFTFTIPR